MGSSLPRIVMPALRWIFEAVKLAEQRSQNREFLETSRICHSGALLDPQSPPWWPVRANHGRSSRWPPSAWRGFIPVAM
jgi:hypothetical protein